ncbi:MAG: FolB domain-containing protein [Rickettsiales bacterium]|jgi:FolB domain-containing protein
MIIKIKNLRIETFLGIYEWEKTHPRTLIFNVQIDGDFEKSIFTDKIEDTLDYDKITNQIRDYTKNNYCHLIEKIVGELLELIMEDQRIKSCTLEVDKTGVYDFVDSFSITQTKNRI